MSKIIKVKDPYEALREMRSGGVKRGELMILGVVKEVNRTGLPLEWLQRRQRELTERIELIKAKLGAIPQEEKIPAQALIARLRADRRKARIEINRHPDYAGPEMNTEMGEEGDRSKFAIG